MITMNIDNEYLYITASSEENTFILCSVLFVPDILINPSHNSYSKSILISENTTEKTTAQAEPKLQCFFPPLLLQSVLWDPTKQNTTF